MEIIVFIFMKAANPMLIFTKLKKTFTVIGIQISSVWNSVLESKNSIRTFTKNPVYCDFKIDCPISEFNFKHYMYRLHEFLTKVTSSYLMLLIHYNTSQKPSFYISLWSTFNAGFFYWKSIINCIFKLKICFSTCLCIVCTYFNFEWIKRFTMWHFLGCQH